MPLLFACGSPWLLQVSSPPQQCDSSRLLILPRSRSVTRRGKHKEKKQLRLHVHHKSRMT